MDRRSNRASLLRARHARLGPPRRLASASSVDRKGGRCAMTTEHDYDPEAFNDTPLDSLPLYIARLDAALWILEAWQERTSNPDAGGFIAGEAANEGVPAPVDVIQSARDDTKRQLAEDRAK